MAIYILRRPKKNVFEINFIQKMLESINIFKDKPDMFIQEETT